MLSVNLCAHLIPTKKSILGFLHTHQSFPNKSPNFYRILKIQPFPNSIYCLSQSIEQNPQTVKDDSLDNEEEQEEVKKEEEEEVDLYTVNYLKNSCGLSEKDAIYVAKRLISKNRKLSEKDRAANANVVLAIFREHGFTPIQISMSVKRHSFVLLSRPYETILPKLEFLQSIGFERGASLGEIVSKDPKVLATSLENKLIPNYELLKDVLESNHESIRATIRRSSNVITDDLTRSLVPNIEVLRDAGVPESKINYMIVNYPVTVTVKHSRFREAVIRVKEMGFDPSHTYFLNAVTCFSRASLEIVWERCYEIYTELGCLNEEIISAFKKRPACMVVSDRKIYKVMDCLVKKMGWPSDDLVKYPRLFRCSVEKRIIPRCSVVLFLHSKGLLKRLPKLSSTLEVTIDYFIERYVTRYAEEVPEVLQIYNGYLEHAS